MNAKTIQGNSPKEIQTFLNQSLADGFKPSLAIIFSGTKQDVDEVCQVFQHTDIEIFGATTSGEFISEEIGENTIVVMLLDIKTTYFKIAFHEIKNGAAFDASKEFGKEGKSHFQNPAFIIVSGWVNIDGERIIAGIQEGCGSEVTIYGGMAGDDLNTLQGSFVFTKAGKSVDGLLGLIIDGDYIDVKGIATCGWKPIGIAKTVTKGSLNVVQEIDHQPALDLEMKYLGSEINPDLGNEELINIGAYYPIQMERDDGVQVMRTVMFGNVKDRSLICAGNVPVGAKVRFSLPPDFDIIDKIVSESTEIRDSQLPEADAVIMFSCISRYLSFGVMTREEIRLVKDVWKVPFAGFFSFGEYGKSKNGKYDFHNNTCCVVALKEKQRD